MKLLRIGFVASLVVPLAWGMQTRDEPLVLRVGKILTASKGTINSGVIIIQGGKITAIGAEADVEIPANARVIDAKDRWATPGLIDLHCHIGGMTGDINDMVNPTNPEMTTRPTIDPASENLKYAVAGGVTTVLYIPGSGTNIGGFGTLMHTAGGKTVDDLIIRWPGGMKVAQAWNPERRGGDLGASRMGMWWGLRKLLDRAKQHHEALTSFEKGLTKVRPEAQPDLELMRGLFQHKYPVIIHTADARDVMGTVRMFHDEYGLKMIVSHGEFGGFKVAEEIAKRDLPANIGPRLYDYDGMAGYVPDGHCYGIATRYWEGGVKRLSLNTDSPVVPQEDLVFQGTMAVHLGLDPETALKALTLEPARAVLADQTKGSLEVGKDADIVLWTGDLFDVRNYVSLVIIRGKVVYDVSQERRRY